LISTLFFFFSDFFVVPNLHFSLRPHLICRFPARESTIRGHTPYSGLVANVAGQYVTVTKTYQFSLTAPSPVYTHLRWSRLVAQLLPTASLLPRSTTSSTHLVLPPTPCGVTRYVTTIARRRWTRNHRGDFPLIRPRSHQVRFFFFLAHLLVIVSKGILAYLVNLCRSESDLIRFNGCHTAPYLSACFFEYSILINVSRTNVTSLLSLFPHRVPVDVHHHHRSIPSCGLLISFN
jgi:hypothetical protein